MAISIYGKRVQCRAVFFFFALFCSSVFSFADQIDRSCQRTLAKIRVLDFAAVRTVVSDAAGTLSVPGYDPFGNEYDREVRELILILAPLKNQIPAEFFQDSVVAAAGSLMVSGYDPFGSETDHYIRLARAVLEPLLQHEK